MGSNYLVRQWTLLKTISAAGGTATIKSLMAQTGAGNKMIRRDLAVLQRAGFPIKETIGEFGRKSFAVDGGAIPRLDLLYDEALALFFCRRAVLPLAGTYIWESLQNAFRKIEASLGSQAAKYVLRMADRLHRTHVGGSYRDQAELIDELLIAIDESKAAFITYRSARSSEPLSYPVEPYGLVEHRGSLYLVGHSQQHGEIRHWKVDRIEAVDRTKFPFQRPAGFDLQTHLADSFGIYSGREQIVVRARLTPAAARYLREKRMHTSQKLSRDASGRTIAQWTVSSTVEIKSFLLSWGAAVEVLEPAELRAEIADELRKALQLYNAEASPNRQPARSKGRKRLRSPQEKT